MEEYHYVYLTTNLINGKHYIGKRTTNNLQDGYIGSGVALKRAIKKYGKENFTSIPLVFCSTEQEAYDLEAYIVDEEWVSFNDNYNLTTGGGYIFHTEEIRDKMSKAKEGMYYGKDNPFYGKKHSKEVSELIIQSNIRRTGIKKPQTSINTRGQGNPNSKLTWDIVNEIRDRYSKGGIYLKDLSKEYSISISQVSNIIRNKSWV